MSESGWIYKLVDEGSSQTPFITGVVGKKIRVLQAVLNINNGSSTWYFQSHTGPTQLVGNLFLESDGGPIVMPYSPIGWFETTVGDDLDLILASGGAGICGVIAYELV
jgi:hypothetical protein